MKILSIFGTRPEIIRLSRIFPLLDELSTHITVWTGQNFSHLLSGQFFEEFKVREPNYKLKANETYGEQIGVILTQLETILAKEQPDRFFVLGDTNSSLGAIAAKRAGIPVFHMEAGNRSFDDRTPEEVNRRIIDSCTDVYMCYTEHARQNLIQEGKPVHRIFVIGNPIWEVMSCHVLDRDPRDWNDPEAEKKRYAIFETLNLQRKRYILATLHRAENVDDIDFLNGYLDGLIAVQRRFNFTLVLSVHPRLKARMEANRRSLSGDTDVILCNPFNFHDFILLMQSAQLVLSDSGTVQEECALLRKPLVTLRLATERPETLDEGSNILAHYSQVEMAATVAMKLKPEAFNNPQYLSTNVSKRAVRLLLSHYR